MKANLTTILLIAATAMIAVPTASANPCTWCRVSHSSGYCAPLCNRRLVQKTKLPIIPSWDEEDDEEAGGFSVEAGYEKDGANVKVKWEQENKDEDVGSWDDFGKPTHTQPHMPDGESLGKWINFRL